LYPKILFSLVAPQVAHYIRMTTLLQHLNLTTDFFVSLLLNMGNIIIHFDKFKLKSKATINTRKGKKKHTPSLKDMTLMATSSEVLISLAL
jgi:hypothetical protein